MGQDYIQEFYLQEKSNISEFRDYDTVENWILELYYLWRRTY